MSDLERLVTGYFAPVFYDGAWGFLRVFWYFTLFELPRLLLNDLAIVRRRLRLRRSRPNGAPIPYSVVVPALNEAETVEMTMRSLLEQSHPPERIIIVDDGSTDETPEVCRRLAASSRRIRYLRQGERNGKSAALNRGLAHVATEIVVFVDSDTTFDRDALRNIVRPFADGRVVACGGVLRVRNRNANVLTEVQALEYGLTITLARQAKAELGILPIISGAFGAFRTEAVRAIGGHEPGPGNDSDLTIDLRLRGGRIEFAHDAVCHTDVPTKLGVLWRQRRRWCRNVIKNRVRKHANLFSPFSNRFRWRDLISTLDPLIYQVVFGWIWFFYVVETVLTVPHLLPAIVLGNWCLYLGTTVMQWSLGGVLSERPREDLVGYVYLPAYHLYRIWHRILMLVAHFEELFTRASLRDPFAPKKVREVMPDW